MAPTAKSKPLLRGRVKAVPSGDTLVIMEMGSTASEIPPERTIILSSIVAPKLARRGGQQSTDEPFAWQSREFLRKLCIGKDVSFQVDYTLARKEVKFGTVYIGDKNIAFLVVFQGWAKAKGARELEKDKGECSPYLKKLLHLEDKAKDQGVGLWSKAAAGAVRNLPPSLVGDPDNLDLDAMTYLVEKNKGRRMEAIVEYVRNGSTLHVYLLPDYEHVRVFVAGVQAPRDWIVEPEKTANGSRGPSSAQKVAASSTSAQKVAASSASVTEGAPESFGRESKHFTETRVLHRDVRIVLEGIDKNDKLIGRVYYLDGKLSIMDLGEQLVENGLAKYVDCGNILQDDVKRRLKFFELEAKKSRLRMWNNYVPPPTISRAIKDQNFTGKVVEVVSGDCILVFDNSLPSGSLLAKRRVYLSSIRCPRHVNGRSEARELLEKHLKGHQVYVSMEYRRQEMQFGSVFESQSRNAEDAPLALPTAGSQQYMTNIAEMMVARGFAEVIRHKDFEPRSNHYDALLNAECHAKAAKEGMHSDKYFEGRDVSNGQAFKVVVKEVCGGGKFYVQLASDQRKASTIQQQLASLKLQEAPAIGSFNPEKGDLVLAQFKSDNSWYRAMIVNVPQGSVRSVEAKFEVYYIDYGTQEFVAYSHLRPWDNSVLTIPGLAQLCSLAHVEVPSLKEDYGKEASCCLSDHILHEQKEFKAITEERDTSGMRMVTLIDTEAEMSINALMLKEGLAKLKTRRGPVFAKLERYEVEAINQRLGMWANRDIRPDNNDKKPPVRKGGGKR